MLTNCYSLIQCYSNFQQIFQVFFVWKLIRWYYNLYGDEGLKMAKSILKKNEVGEFILPDYTNYYKCTIFMILWYWWKDRQTDKTIWNSETGKHI